MADLAAAIRGKLIACLSVMQAALPRLRSDGSVTLIGAGSAESALPATAGLAAVNGGLHAAMRPLAVELAPLRVNAVAPGVIETPWWAGMPSATACSPPRPPPRPGGPAPRTTSRRSSRC